MGLSPLSLCMGVWPIGTRGAPSVSLTLFSWHTAQSQRACANSDTAGVNRVSQALYTHWAGADPPAWPSVTYKSTHRGHGNNSKNWNYNDVEWKGRTQYQRKPAWWQGTIHTHIDLNQCPPLFTALSREEGIRFNMQWQSRQIQNKYPRELNRYNP